MLGSAFERGQVQITRPDKIGKSQKLKNFLQLGDQGPCHTEAIANVSS